MRNHFLKMLLIYLAIIFVIVSYILKEIKRPKNFPPGPPWLPFVGNGNYLKKLSRRLNGQHHALTALAKQYNTNVLGLKLGNEYAIAVLSYPVIKRVLLSEEFDGRPDNFFIRLRCMGSRNGVTCIDGESWSIQRNFVVRHLRNLGFGKKVMETMVKEEIADVLSLIETNGTDVKIGSSLLAPAVVNILWALTTGSRISRTDQRFKRLLKLLDTRAHVFDMTGGMLSQFPWLRYISPNKTGYSIIQEFNRELKAFFKEVLQEHYRTWTEDRDDDFIYAFITEMKKQNSDKSFTENQLIMVCFDLFIAGAKTTSDTLDFAFLMMILHADIQRKVQHILDSTLDRDTAIEYFDRNRLPYVEAVLMEVERYRHVVPVTGPRRVLRDTVLEGYSIPKNTTVLIVSHSVHSDPSYWKDPELFLPERFLNEDGKIINHEQFIPFGLGKRRCLGETLAKNCLFVFFSEIMRNYSISAAPGSNEPTGVPIAGLTLSPENYKAQFIKRYL